jgi:hypothetical protein
VCVHVGWGHVKLPNSKYTLLQVPTCSDPNILGHTPKIKVQLPIFFNLSPEGPKEVCHIPVEQKCREEIDFEQAKFVWGGTPEAG